MLISEDDAGRLLRTLDGEPAAPSTVDIEQAMRDGRRRRRARRAVGMVATAVLTVSALAGVPVAAGALRDGPDRPGPAATATDPDTAAVSGSTATTRAGAPAVPAPTACVVEALPVPDNRRMAVVTGADPTGRLIVGRSYGAGGGDHHVLLWHDGRVAKVPMTGDDKSLNDITTDGVGVGVSFVGGDPVAWLFRAGDVTRLPGGVGAQAHAINAKHRIVGERNHRPVLWRSPSEAPVELSLPAGATAGAAQAIDTDGTVVGYVAGATGELAYVWLPDGTGRALPTPSAKAGSDRGLRAYTLRDGWATGIAGTGDDSAVRWNLRTGEVRAYAEFQIRASTANAHGWLVGTDTQGRGLLLAGDRPVVLPDLFLHRAGELTNIAETLSDDGRTIGGQADDPGGVIRAVVWRCS